MATATKKANTAKNKSAAATKSNNGTNKKEPSSRVKRAAKDSTLR